MNKANKYFLQMDSGEDKISVTQLINELKGKGISQKGLVEAYNQHIQNIKARLKIDYSRTTLKRYKSSLKGFSCNYRDNYRECLTQEEVESIYHAEIKSNRIERIRDIYMFQIHTGFTYSDLANLSTDSTVVLTFSLNIYNFDYISVK